MSLGAPSPIDAALLPPAIRSASPQRQQAYTAALGFERLLVQQLTSSLAESADSTFGSEGSPYASMLPDALTQGVMDGGGLGLAAQLTDAIDPAAQAPPSGGAA